jgi:hypothetical protein
MDEAGLDQRVGRISPLRQVAAEYSTRGVSDRELLDQARTLHTPAVQVIYSLGVLLQLLPVEVDRFSQRVLWAELGRAEFLFQMSGRLPKG